MMRSGDVAILAMDIFTYYKVRVSMVDPFLKAMTEELWEVTRLRRVPGMWMWSPGTCFYFG